MLLKIESICTPLESGNSKPFYKHRKQVVVCIIQLSLKLSNAIGTLTDDLKKCATLSAQHFLLRAIQRTALNYKRPKLYVEKTNLIEISPEGLIKLLHELKSGKTAGPDGIWKKSLLAGLC